MRSRAVSFVAAVVVAFGVFVGSASASDKAVAKQLVVTQADVGSTYTAAKSTSNSNTYPQLAACVGKPVSKRAVTAHVEGPDLTNTQDGSVISSSAEFVKTTRMAKTDRGLISDPKFADCIAQLARTQLASQGVTDVNAQRVNLKPYGSYSTAIEARLSGTANGQPLQLTAVEIGILKGRAELMATFITNGTQPFDQNQGQAILDKVNQRLKKAKT
jgi:hypothetical protein